MSPKGDGNGVKSTSATHDGSPINDNGYSSVSSTSSDSAEDDFDDENEQWTLTTAREKDSTTGNDAEVSQINERSSSSRSSSPRGFRKHTKKNARMTSSQRVQRELKLHMQTEGHNSSTSSGTDASKGSHHAHHFITAREIREKQEEQEKNKRRIDKAKFFYEFQSRKAHRYKLKRDPIAPSKNVRSNKMSSSLAVGALSLGTRTTEMEILNENDKKKENKKRRMKMSVSAVAAAAAREALELMRTSTPAPTQCEIVRTLHALRLYTPSAQYVKSLNPESKLFSTDNEVKRKQLMTIDLYLDTVSIYIFFNCLYFPYFFLTLFFVFYFQQCDVLGIVPEPLIVGVLEQGTKSTPGIEKRKEEEEEETALCLTDKSLGNKSIVALCTALAHEKCHAEYTSMHLENNRISGGIGAKAIASMIESHGLCRSLHLRGNDLRTHGAAELGRSLSNSQSNVLHLDLGDNNIGRDGVLALCSGLKCNQSLISLNLSKNSLTHTSAPILSAMLRENNTLQILNLSWNGLAGQGTIEIFDSLRRKPPPPIKKKRKKKNKKKETTESQTTDRNNGAVKEAKWNTSLRSLDLSWCGVGNKSMPVAMKIVDTLRMCTLGSRDAVSLTHLNLSNNGLSTTACLSIVVSV